MLSNVTKIGKRGAIVIPAALRQRFGFNEGELVVAEETAEGVLIRPAVALAVEHYSAERQAEFLLSNAVGAEDYQRAIKDVRKLGIDPENIKHYKPLNEKEN